MACPVSSLIDLAVKKLYQYVDAQTAQTRAFRAIVTGTSSGMVTIRRIHASTGETALRARVVGYDLAVSDEVLCLPMADGIPVVVGKLQRATPTSYALSPSLVVASINSPYTEAPVVSNSAVTGSNASTSTYEVNVRNTSFDLPAGTWTVDAFGGGFYAHSSASGIVRVHMQVDDDAGTALTMRCPADPDRAYIGVANRKTGASGSISIRMEYRPSASGTAYAGGGWLYAIAYRTA